MPSTGPVSAFAARKARQQQAQNAAPPKIEQVVDKGSEPPSKRPRRSTDAEESHEYNNGTEIRATRTRSSKKQNEAKPPETVKGQQTKSTRSTKSEVMHRAINAQVELEEDDRLEDGPDENGEMSEDEVTSVLGDADGYESPADTPAELQNFPLSKARLNKSSIVYADDSTLCVRIKERTVCVGLYIGNPYTDTLKNLALLGQYDLWIKRGVVSLMGAKLHPSPRVYRVYAPSTHSLPVIKCVAGVDGAAEVEVKSCHNGLSRLRDLSPLYQRIWNGQNTAADKVTLKDAHKNSRRTFSAVRNDCPLMMLSNVYADCLAALYISR